MMNKLARYVPERKGRQATNLFEIRGKRNRKERSQKSGFFQRQALIRMATLIAQEQIPS